MELKQGDVVLLDGLIGMVFMVNDEEIEVKVCDTDGSGTVCIIGTNNIEKENIKLIKSVEFLMSQIIK